MSLTKLAGILQSTRVGDERLIMTDLTLSQFRSLSKRELRRVLKQEELEMHGSHPRHGADPPSRSSSARLLRMVSSVLRIPSSLKRKLIPNLRPNSPS